MARCSSKTGTPDERVGPISDPIARLNGALEGRYQIERELGEGGIATVYLAEDLTLDAEEHRLPRGDP